MAKNFYLPNSDLPPPRFLKIFFAICLFFLAFSQSYSSITTLFPTLFNTHTNSVSGVKYTTGKTLLSKNSFKEFSKFRATPVASFEVVTSSVIEVPLNVALVNQVTIAVMLSEPSTSAVTVNFATSGTPTQGILGDYTLPGGTSVTFNPGEVRKLITVNINYNDQTTEDLILTLTTATGANISPSQKTHTLKIFANNSTTGSKQDVSFVSSTLSIAENAGTTIQIPLVIYYRTNKTVDATTIAYSLGGTAQLGVDYQIVSTPNQITFPGGLLPGVNVSSYIEIRPINNGLVDGNRTITVTLAGNALTGLGKIPVHTFTIVDDDRDPLLSSSLTPPDICSGTNFSYHPTSNTAGTTFIWSRLADAYNAASAGTGDINQTLINNSTSPIAVTYKYTLTSGISSTIQNVVVMVNPTPKLTSSTTPPDIFSNGIFNYTIAATPSAATISWVRPLVSGITPSTLSGNASTINEILQNSTASPIQVTYRITISANGCSNTQDVKFMVNPAPSTNQLPVATDVINFPIQNIPEKTGILPLTGYDPDGSINSFTISVIPTAAMGKLFIDNTEITGPIAITTDQAKNLKFQVNASFTGTVTFKFRVTDNQGAASANDATFSIPVTATVSSMCQNSQLGPNLLKDKGTFSTPYISPNPVVNSVNNGSIPAAPLLNTGLPKPDLTNYNYASASGQLGPEGTYSFLKKVGIPNVTPRNPIKGDWLGEDHTGDGGYFMIINGATNAGITNTTNGQTIGKTFYQQKTITVCPNTLYEFSAYVLNVLPGNSPSAGAGSQPNISFYINNEHVSTSGPIAYSTATTNYAPQWVKVGGLWYSGPNTTVDLRIDNASTAAAGNDLGLDDISMAICGLDISYPATGTDPKFCLPGSLPLEAQIRSSVNTYSYYIFQRKKVGETDWTDISAPKQGIPIYNGSQYVYTATYGTIPVDITMNGDQYRVKVATDPNNLIGVDCNISASTVVTVGAFENVTLPPGLSICDGTQTASLGATKPGETWAFVSGPATATITQAGAVSGITLDGTYVFELSNAAGCKGTVEIKKENISGKAGPDMNICSFVMDYKFAAAGSGYNWSAGSGNPAPATIDASTGQVNGMTVNGTYRFLLNSQTTSCSDEVLIIRSNCPSPSISIAANPVGPKLEGTGGASTPMTFRISRDPGTSLIGNIDFSYKLLPLPVSPNNADAADFTAGSAVYNASPNVTIPSGSAFVDIIISVNPDAIPEFDELFTVQIESKTAGVSVTTDQANQVIVDDDTPAPYASFELPASVKRENDQTPLYIKVKLTTASDGTGASVMAATYTKVNFALTGSATKNVDYYFPAGSPGDLGYVEFLPGQSEVLIPVYIIDDNIIEPTETIILNLNAVNTRINGQPAASIVTAKKQHTVTILENDNPPTAFDETYFLKECGTFLSGTVLNGESDPDGDPITFILGAYDTSKGTITIDPNTGAFTFTPILNPRFEGPLLVSYKVSDGFHTTDAVLSIKNPFPLLLIVNSVPTIPCYGESSGSITLAPQGGSGNYTYQWTDGPTTKDRSNLTAGLYTVIVTDVMQGCSVTTQIVVSQYPQIFIDPISLDVSCFGGNDGGIDSHVTGGSGTFTYTWTGPNGFTAASENLSNLKAGTYHLSVKDSEHGCVVETDILVNQPAQIVNNNISSPALTYCGISASETLTGSTPSGGNGIYTYKWYSSTDGLTFTEITDETDPDYTHPDLTQTTYYKRVVFSGNCDTGNDSNILQIIVYPIPDVVANSLSQTICTGNATSINLTNPNGVAGTTFSWTISTNANITGAFNSTGNGLTQTLVNTSSVPQSLTYTITPMANGCSGASIDVIVTVNPVISNNVISADQSIFVGQAPAALSGTIPSGGNGTYSYQWESSTTDASTNFSPITGATSAIYSPGILTQTTWYRRIVYSGDCAQLISNAVKITVNPIANITIVKTNNQTSYTAGLPTTYLITVHNNGPSDAQNVVVSDPLPAGIPSASMTWTADNATSGTGAINQTLPTLVNGATVTYTVVIQVPSGYTGTLQNIAAATSTTPDPTPGDNTSTDTDNPNPKADITIVKTNNQTSYTAGLPTTYLITVHNNGPSDAQNVVVSDPLPAGIPSASMTWTADNATSGTGAINQTLPTLVNGATVTYTVVIQVPSGYTGTLQNIAAATSTTPDPTPGDNTSTDTDNPNPKADITIVKTNNQTSYTAGLPTTYLITVHNNGPSDAQNVVVSDPLPAGIPSASMTWTADNATSGTGAINQTLPTLVNGATVTYTVVIQVPSGYTGTLQNIAAATSTTPDPTPGDNTSTDTDNPNPKADITIVKTNNQTSYTAGLPTTYLITVHNNGPSDAQNVIVSDPLPAGIPSASMTWTADNATSGTGAINQTLPTLVNGATVTYTVVIQVPSGYTGTLQNIAAATSTTPDPTPGDNTSTDTDNPNPKADITIVKTNNQTSYTAGLPTTYLITVHNNGPSDAQNVIVSDPLPAGIPSASMTWTADNATSGTGAINQTLPTLVNGATVTYTVVIQVPSGYTGTLQNIAAATSTTPDPTPGDNTSTDTDNPNPKADITIVKTNNQTSYTAGLPTTYLITVHNNGPSDAQNVIVSDPLPAGIPSASMTWTADNATSGTGAINQTLPTLVNGATVTYTVVIQVPSGYTGPLQNIAAATSTTPDPTPGDNTSTDTDNPNPKADITIVKTNNQTSYTAGLPTTYLITVHNNGPSDAQNVIVSDPLPAGIPSASMTWTADNATSGTGAINQTLPTLVNGATVTYTVVIQVPSGYTGTLQNIAAATSTTPDPTPGDNTSTDTDNPNPKADITIVKTNNQTSYTAGLPTTYLITVHNNGPSDAQNVVVSDPLPAGIPSASMTWTADNATSGTGAINQTLPTLVNGATVTYTVVIQVPSGYTGPLQNIAAATSTTPDPTPGDNTSTDTDNPNPKADITIVKTNNQTSYTAGLPTTYLITVHNNGPSDAQNVVVSDPLPAGIPSASMTWTADNATSGTGAINQTLPTLVNGATVTYTVVIQVPSGYTGPLQNIAAATSTTPDPTPGDNTSTDTDNPNPKADITIVKTNNQTSYTAGLPTTYLITVHNNGPSDAQNVIVSDPLPAGIPSASMTWTADNATSGTGAINQTLPVLVNGATVTYTVVIQVPSGYTGTLQNIAAATSTTPDPTPGDNTSTDTDNPNPKADITIVKTNNQTSYTAGLPTTYLITVHNNGPSDAQNVIVSDPLPAGIPSASMTWTADNATSGTGAINQTLPVLVNAATVTYTVVIQVPSGYTGLLQNIAAATSTTPDPTPGDNTSTDTDNPNPKADITIVKTNNQTSYTAGLPTTYLITVHNNGPSDAQNVIVSDPLPAGIPSASMTWTADNATSGTGAINQTLPVLVNAATVTYTVVIQVPSGYTGTLQNIAAATSTTPDPTPGDNTSTDTDNPNPKADITIVKTNNQTSYTAGLPTTYLITVHNNGPSDAQNVIVSDPLPAGIPSASMTWTADNATSGTGAINQTLPVLVNAATVTYTVVIQVPSGYTGPLQNIAAATSTTPDPTPGDNTSTDTDNPNPKADITIVKTNNQTSYTAGLPTTYLITVHNNGPSDAQNVIVSDPLPAGIPSASMTWTADNATSGTGAINQTLPTLVNGATVTYTVVIQVPSGYTGPLQNIAAATSTTPDPTPGDNTSTDTDNPNPKADITIVKTNNQTSYTAGLPTTYLITVHNNGPSDAQNVIVSDPLPAGIPSASMTWTADNATSGTGAINQTLPVLVNGATVTYTVVIQVPSGYTGTLQNIAAATSTTPDPTPGDNTSTDTDNPNPKADITIVKTNNQTSYTAGLPTTYLITVHNNGPSDAQNVVVSDPLPAGIPSASMTWTADNATSGTGAINQTLPTLVNGATVTYTVVIQVPSGYTGPLQNIAAATSTTPDPTPGDNTSTDTDNPNPKADITIVKTNNQTSYTAGLPTTYLITVHNNGPSDAQNVVVSDPLPAGIPSASMTWTADNATSGTGAINQTLPTLVNGATVTYTVVIQVPSGYTGPLQNIAAATSTTPDPTPGDNTSTDTDNPNPKADITIVKTNNQTSYTAGLPTTYLITVHNNGPSDAQNVVVSDPLPAGIPSASMTWTADNATSGTGAINQTLPTLVNGATVTYTVVIQVPSGYTGTLQNIAAATSTTPDPTPGDNTSTDTDNPNPKADITIVKTNNQTSYTAGLPTTYLITVHNNGPSDAQNVIVSDPLPAGIPSASMTWTADNATSGTGAINQTLPTLVNGATVTYTVVIQVPSGYTGPLQNIAAATSTTPDPTPGDNTSTDTDNPSPKADITIVKTNNQTSYTAGLPTTYLITVHNNGPSDAQNVVVSDPLPAGIPSASMTWTADNATSGTGAINQTLPTLVNGATVTYTVVIQVPSGYTGPLQNIAAATSTTPDPTPGDNTSTDTDNPNPKADITIVKTNNQTSYTAGLPTTYLITVHNNGPSDAQNVIVSDPLPAGIPSASMSWSASNGSTGIGAINQTLPVLVNGATVTYTVIIQVPSRYTGSLQNTATATSTTPDPTPGDNTSTDTDSPNPKASVSIIKTNNQTKYIAGQATVYTITVKNTGPSDARDVRVTDALPAGISSSQMKWTASDGSSGTGAIDQILPVLIDGSTLIYTVTINIPSGYLGNLTNTATATSTTPDPIPGDNTSTDIDAPDPKADVVTVKTTAAFEYVPGQTVTYTVVVKNNGPSDARDVKVQDLAPAGTSIESWTAIGNLVNPPRLNGSGNLAETITVLPNQASVTYTIVLRIPSAFRNPLSNTVVTTSTTADPVPGCTSCTTPPILPEPDADLVFDKTLKNAEQKTYLPGDDVIYQITVSNRGPGRARDVEIKDIAPLGTSISKWTATSQGVTLPAYSGTGNLEQLIPNFPNGASVIYTVTLKTPISLTSAIVNLATISSPTHDPIPGSATNPNPECDICAYAPNIDPVITADLSVVKQSDSYPVGLGMVYNYNLTVTNNGYFTAHNVVLYDPLPIGITYVPQATDDPALIYDPVGRTFTYQAAKLLPKETKTFTFKVQADVLGKMINTATVRGDEPDRDMSNNSSTDIKAIVGLKIPNAITPNGDGYNDKLIITGTELYKDNSLIIYNRWGNEVFRSKGKYLNDWTGEGLSGGTYYYVLKLTSDDGKTQTITGYVSLLKN